MEKKTFDEGNKSSMTNEKISALNSIGFQWAKRKGQAAWDEKFQELVQYKAEHGDCMYPFTYDDDLLFFFSHLLCIDIIGQVPTKYPANPALGRWVSTQRSHYKDYLAGDRSKMTDERFQRLDGIGFIWRMMN
jgi:hypothetical protein